MIEAKMNGLAAPPFNKKPQKPQEVDTESTYSPREQQQQNIVPPIRDSTARRKAGEGRKHST